MSTLHTEWWLLWLLLQLTPLLVSLPVPSPLSRRCQCISISLCTLQLMHNITARQLNIKQGETDLKRKLSCVFFKDDPRSYIIMEVEESELEVDEQGPQENGWIWRKQTAISICSKTRERVDDRGMSREACPVNKLALQPIRRVYLGKNILLILYNSNHLGS